LLKGQKKRKPFIFCTRGWLAVVLVLFVCFAVFSLTIGIIYSRQGNDFFRNLTIQSEDGFDSGLVELAAESVPGAVKTETEESGVNDFNFTAWTEFGNELVSNAFSKKRCSANITAICGSSYCLLPFGKELSPQDTKGCIIGSGMAEKLFGTYKAEGQEVIWRDKKWIVRGVVEEPADLVMLEVSGIVEEITFHRISILLDGVYDRQLTGEKFAIRHGISAEAIRLDYLYGISWFKEMVPDKWSDFSGWKQNFKEHKEATKLAQNTEKSTIEAAGLDYQKKGRRYFLFGFFCLVIFSLGYAIKSQKFNK